jgi:hypothetical protein
MKKILLISIFLIAVVSASFGQSPVKATIRLKDGKIIEAYHFGKLKCESNNYASNFTILKGKFHDTHTEISEYNDISKLIFTGFTDAPAPSVGNQKGSITVIKKNGVNVQLSEAELMMSCFNPADRYNEIHVQVINPLNDKKTDVAIEMRKIESITF